MITEDYVSFETAKLLKEKGFDWMESPFYSEQDRDEWKRNAWYSIPNPCYNENIPFDSPTLYVTAPHISLQMAMKWLREVHKLSIEPYYDIVLSWVVDIKHIGKHTNSKEFEEVRSKSYNSYEQACEATIKYCLENLI